MLVVVWIALALLVLVLVGGLYHVVREGLRAWRVTREFVRVAGAGADLLAARADEAARKADGADAAAARLAQSSASLQRSLAYAQVIADATAGAYAALTRVDAAIPRK